MELSYQNLAEQPANPSRVIIDKLVPEIDGGRFAAKAFIDELVNVKAHVLVDGHEHVKVRVLYKHESEEKFEILPLKFLWNDEWIGSFQPKKLGRYEWTVEAVLDRFETWRLDIVKKAKAQQDIQVDFQIGLELLRSYGSLLTGSNATTIKKAHEQITKYAKNKNSVTPGDLETFLQQESLTTALEGLYEDPSYVRYDRIVPIQVEPALTRFSSWYEFFPRSTVGRKNTHGTFKDAEARLDYVKRLGFNVLYFPPIHPIGNAFRKGKNNTLNPGADDVGSPWAIGSAEGGHKSILPALGTIADFQQLVRKARGMNIEVAMDIAFQCSPDHPYVKEHPEWFKKRPDGTIQYAENPPKKYQDIYPFDFECADWRGLWHELRDVILFWIDKGVRVFRVDNPHTKSFHFWEWTIRTLRQDHPDVIFLSEAFTRPKVMGYLAKAGFSQSYTYFTWRNVKWELTQYMTELTQTEFADYFMPNFWPNTPDILPFALQKPDKTTYMQRLILAATLSSSYGIYGPAFETMESRRFKEGGEEYLDSEKYELRTWNFKEEDSLAPLIRLVNDIRNNQKALQQTRNIRILTVNNDNLFAFEKNAGDEKILVVVSLNSSVQSGVIELPLNEWKVTEDQEIGMQDLLTGAQYTWRGWRSYIELHPEMPAHIFKVQIPRSAMNAKETIK